MRKHLGRSHIPADYAEALNAFNQNMPSLYLNYHRLCLHAAEHVDATGKICKTYPADKFAMPYEKLKSLPNAE